jgi:hypothetical protein
MGLAEKLADGYALKTVDRAKRFYQKVGFRLDINLVAGENFRIVRSMDRRFRCT